MNAQRQQVVPANSSFIPAPGGLLQRKCACGNHANGGECEGCHKKRQPLQRASVSHLGRGTEGEGNVPPIVQEVLRSPGQPLDPSTRAFMEPRFGQEFSQVAVHHDRPTKARAALPEDRDKAKPSPYQGSATIQCDGSNGYEIVYGSWAGATCGTKDCVTAHESSHIADWKAKWPTGCKGQPKGYLPKGDPPDNPLMTVDEYSSFLKKSECKAHTVDLACAEALPRTKGCEKTIDDYIKLTREQKANWCPGLSRGAKVAIGIGGGALAGAGIGFLAGGPLGAAIGAGVGALVGGIAGALL